MNVIPYPKEWLSYRDLPGMKNKQMGVFAHVFVRNGAQDAIKEIYKSIVDTAIEEPTCIILAANQSLVNTVHNLLYEEWESYEEFFQVQMTRSYRSGFKKWIDTVLDGVISPEFTEIFYSSGKHPYDIEYNAYTLIKSVHIQSGQYDRARKLLAQYIDDIRDISQSLVANVHQSINISEHFLLYEVWSDFGYLIENELISERRKELEAQLNELIDPALPKPATELYQVYYAPDKYSHGF